MILGHCKTALDPKPAQAACLCRRRIVFADWFFPSHRIGSCCRGITGPKGREEFNVERWICRESAIEQERDGKAAITLRKLENARGHGASTGMRKRAGKCCD
jgi:transposase